MEGTPTSFAPPPDFVTTWRQVVEDVCVVTLGAPAEDSLLRLVGEAEPVDVKAGQTARLAVNGKR